LGSHFKQIGLRALTLPLSLGFSSHATSGLASIGDSITAAVNAEVIWLGSLPYLGEQPWVSWVNGRYGFLQWLLGLTNPESHNQRINWKYGWRGRRNYMFAEPGADSYDFKEQARKAVNRGATYVTVLLGNNDVCVENATDITSFKDFKKNIKKGLKVLKKGLPRGATIYVIGIPDISKLWAAISNKLALGLLPCPCLWALAATPQVAWPALFWSQIEDLITDEFTELIGLLPSHCAGLLVDPYNAGTRDLLSAQIGVYNGILEGLVADFNTTDSNHNYYYTRAAYDHSITSLSGNEISDIDCYHPSGEGQRVLSEITWEDGPFFP
jgi:hypothetical protein